MLLERRAEIEKQLERMRWLAAQGLLFEEEEVH